jgi:aerobic carbon-monoxide dehydrogenase small subunit
VTARYPVTLTVNGRRAATEVGSDETLLAVLRRVFRLTSCRESCGIGLCGTCTVSLDGRVVSSCIMLARLADGAEVETVEAVGSPGGLSDLQAAFVAEGALQCGFCTPGMIMMSRQLLRENPDPSAAEIAEYLAGNICRCGSYPEIIRAVRRCAQERAAARPQPAPPQPAPPQPAPPQPGPPQPGPPQLGRS